MRLVSVGSQHSAQGEVGANISVEHEEGLRAPSQDLIPEVVETTSCAQRGKFLQVPVPRDPRASSVRSEESDTMNLGTDPSCSHRETQYTQEFRNLPVCEGDFWQCWFNPLLRTQMPRALLPHPYTARAHKQLT